MRKAKTSEILIFSAGILIIVMIFNGISWGYNIINDIFYRYTTKGYVDALYEGDDELVSKYLKKGYDPNYIHTSGPNNDKEPVIYIASRDVNYDVLKVLVENGTNINVKATLHYAKPKPQNLPAGSPAVFVAYEDTPLHKLVREPSESNVKYLLEKGADPNIRDDSGQTALFDTIDGNMYSITKLLLEHRADPNIEDNNGCTALTFSIFHNQPRVADELMNFNAKTEQNPTCKFNDKYKLQRYLKERTQK